MLGQDSVTSGVAVNTARQGGGKLAEALHL